MSQSASPSPRPASPTDRDCKTLARSFEIEGLRLTETAGLLVMEGQVPCYRMKKLAGSAAGRLVGALRVVNRLRVVPESHRCDSELVEAARAALAARMGLRNETIAISVRRGIVTLQGSISSPALRCEAELAAWALGGVVDVENRLRLMPLLAGNGQTDGDASLCSGADNPVGEDV